ncbi:hypothetical protein ACGF0J_10900 [Nonomuraea sp. NPDC047897]|uniref:hypothetical protein n=1 Tax=Nonomuraea sp. NPDC047897 TaxID=3364346 RepID=UPI0037213453
MSIVVIPMRKLSGGMVELTQILNALPENVWAWSILELGGTGTAPQGMTMQAFEDTVSSSEAGYLLSWRELVNIASDLEQVHDCRIAAAKCPHSSSSQNGEWDSSPELLVMIKGCDSVPVLDPPVQ